MARKILTGDVVVFRAGPGLLTLANSAVVTCPGRYTLPAAKGKYRFMPYADGAAAVSFTVSARPAGNAEVTTHELGEAPAPAEPETGAADEGQTDASAPADSAAAEDKKGTGE